MRAVESDIENPTSPASPVATSFAEVESVSHQFVAVNDAAECDNIWRSLRELWQYRTLIRELVQRDLKLRYKNSIGGIAWSLLNPLMTIFVITMVMKFGNLAPIKNYSAYLFGIVFLWNFFQSTLLDGCVSIVGNANLVRKVYFPRAVLPIVTLLSNGFHFAIAFVFTMLYFFVLGAYPDNLRPVMLMAIPTIFFTMVLALGLSFILAYLNVFYEDVRFIAGALLQVAFYVTPVFFTIEQVAAHPKIYLFYMMNPIAAFLVTYQRALLRPPMVQGLHGTLPPIDIPWGYFGLACLSSTVILLVGLRLFEHYKWEISERV